MTSYHLAGETRNSHKLSSGSNYREPVLTHGGEAIKRLRPTWSASVCNVVASLANLGQEASTHAR